MWQAGLLCLMATAQAVVVHQLPVYASHNIHPKTVYNTALNPQTTYSQPQTTYSQPQTTYSPPQTTFSQPHTTYSQPHTTYSQPHTTYSHPQTIYSNPQATYSHPQTIYNYPQRPLSYQPQINHLQPSSIPSNQKEDEYDEPSYSFIYQIDDDLTGDHKSHSETREGDVVQGNFTELRADGILQITNYTAGKDGYHAQIRLVKGAGTPPSATKVPEAVYPVVQNFVPRYTQTQPSKYQNGPVTFTPAKYGYHQLQPAPVTEQTKHTAVTVKPPAAYNPVVYASASTGDKGRTAPGSFTNPNQIPYKPVQYA